jgi:hypothetical protein
MLPYDYGSVMYYGANNFTSNGLRTIIPTRNVIAFIGQRIGMSDIGILEVHRYYGCFPTPTSITTVTASTTSTTSGLTIHPLRVLHYFYFLFFLLGNKLLLLYYFLLHFTLFLLF